VENGYPLIIDNVSKVEYEETEFKPEFITKILSKLDLSTVMSAWQQLGHTCLDEDVPKLPPLPSTVEELQNLINSEDSKEERESVLKTLHTILLDVHVMEGQLQCPATKRVFPIKGGIPNMILHADEI